MNVHIREYVLNSLIYEISALLTLQSCDKPMNMLWTICSKMIYKIINNMLYFTIFI